MRILHTSDWHLGRTLYGHSRAPEHEAFLDELVDVARDVDLVLISGDVHETSNPPIEAEELLFDALARLGDGGRRGVVVIAGNHDSPDRLRAPGPLTTTHGVWILGRPGDVPSRRRSSTGVQVADCGPSWLALDTARGRAVVAAVPYPSEARLRQLLSASLEERDLQAAYERRLRQVFADLAGHFRPDAVNLLTSHLSISSCMPSHSERALVGGAYQVDASVLPATADYVALGHLHLAQAVADAPCPTRYAGAPLALRFSERDYPRAHVIVDIEPGQHHGSGLPRRPAQVELVPIRAGRPLVVWQADGIEAVERGVAEGLHADAFVDLELHVDARLTHAELRHLERLPRTFARVRAVLPDSVVTPLLDPARRRDLPVETLFRAFYRDETGNEPDPELTALFVELAGDEGDRAASQIGTTAASCRVAG